MTILTDILSINAEILEKHRRIVHEERHRLRSISAVQNHHKFSVDEALAHKTKNRYSDVLPYDQTRVKIRSEGGYINASRIMLKDICNKTKEGYYIATQGPMKNTVNDFWEMCKELNDEKIVIVMVTALREKEIDKCYQYWRDGNFDICDSDGKTLFHFDAITHYFEDGGFEVRKWLMTDMLTSHKREVVHFYYDAWQDFGRPNSHLDIISLAEEVIKEQKSIRNLEKNPLIVHCSAGVGRTGAFISLHYMLSHLQDMLNTEGKFICDGDPIEQIVYELRKQRMLMVGPSQFQFVYDAVRSCWKEQVSESVHLSEATKK